MPLVSLFDLEKSLNLLQLGAPNVNTNNPNTSAFSKELDLLNARLLLDSSNKLNLKLNGQNSSPVVNTNTNPTNNSQLLLQQKLILNTLKNDYLNTLNQLTNSTLLNANNLQSLLLINNLNNAANSVINSNGNLNSSLAGVNSTTSSISSQNSQNSKQINYSRYKTELCRQFSENGECKV
jgi:hypothetical protein